ncbi:MAG: DUF5615 family PIN-like protein [Deltaproteobacteria bacterium]|nr:DUF5615 family PIN-like protein [Deltaproteobacteria bacterium]
MRLLIDMNLSPTLCSMLAAAGFDATHWSDAGEPDAADTVLMEWARTNEAVVVTHDLDFGILLALTRAVGPSVVQVRGLDASPESVLPLLVGALRQFSDELRQGALVTIQPERMRARVLPIR